MVRGSVAAKRLRPETNQREKAEPREIQQVRGSIRRRTEVKFPAQVVVGDPYDLSVQLVPGEGEAPEEDTGEDSDDSSRSR